MAWRQKGPFCVEHMPAFRENEFLDPITIIQIASLLSEKKFAFTEDKIENYITYEAEK